MNAEVKLLALQFRCRPTIACLIADRVFDVFIVFKQIYYILIDIWQFLPWTQYAKT